MTETLKKATTHRSADTSGEAESSSDIPAIRLEGVEFAWSGKGGEPDLRLDELRLRAGERLFVCGPSGSGKSTLLSLMSGVVVPARGTVELVGQNVSALSPAVRDHFRADHIGYIFQMFNLIPYLSVLDNVTLPLRYSVKRRALVEDAQEEAGRLLDHLGLADFLNRRVTDLSVGQQQRVAAARALIGAPEIILADEPTSSLDLGNSKRFIELLFAECEEANSTLVFVSHDERLAGEFDRSVKLGVGGRI